MKKILIFALAFVLMLTGGMASAFGAQEISVTVDGQTVVWTDAAPFIDASSRTLVPLRAVAEALGLAVEWDVANRQAVFSGANGAKVMRFPIDSKTAALTEDGSVQAVSMDTAAIIRNGRTYAPVRYLAEAFGYVVEWDGATRTVQIDQGSAAAAGTGIEVGGTKTPMDAPAGLDMGYATAAADVGSWSYFVANEAAYDGQDFIMVCRDNPKGDCQILFSAYQNTSLGGMLFPHTISYVDKSYEQSDGRFLYFTVQNGDNWHNSLYCFDLETEYFNQVLGEPCSNMVLFDKPAGDIAGLGWILYDHYIVAIDLSKGTTYEGLSMDIEEMEGAFSDIGISFFYGIGDWGTRKFPQLSALYDGALEIDVILAEPETSAPELHSRYQYDCLTMSVWQERL